MISNVRFTTHPQRPSQRLSERPSERPRVALLALGVLALSACSDSDPTVTTIGPAPDDTVAVQVPVDVDADDRPGMIVTGVGNRDSRDVQTRWLVNMGTFRLESLTPGSGDGFVDLVDYGDGIRMSRHIEFYEPDLDTCEVDDGAPPPVGGGGGGGSPPPSISGGATVTINSPAGPWFIYTRDIDDDGQILYRTNNGLPGALPQGATLTVPGDQFPAIAAHPLFSPTAPVRLLPDANVGLTADSAYSWIPGPAHGYMEISFKAYDDQGNFIDFVGLCEMVDDGSFTMPQRVRDFIAASTVRIEARYARIYSRLDLLGDVVVRQRMVVAE